MPPGRVSLPLLLLVAACGTDTETTRLVLTAGACDLPQLGKVHSVQATLQPGQPGDCLVLEPKTLEALQAGLAGKVSFRGLAPGTYSLVLRGFDDKACKGTVVACGSSPLQLPPASATISVPVDCYGGPSPPPEFARCAGK